MNHSDTNTIEAADPSYAYPPEVWELSQRFEQAETAKGEPLHYLELAHVAIEWMEERR